MYRAVEAEAAAARRSRRPKRTRLSTDASLVAVVREKLEEDWSPEQIAAWLRRAHPLDPNQWISHETIYRSIYVTNRRELGPHAFRHLRSRRSLRTSSSGAFLAGTRPSAEHDLDSLQTR